MMTPRETLLSLGFTPEQTDEMLNTAGLSFKTSDTHKAVLTASHITKEALRVLEENLTYTLKENI